MDKFPEVVSKNLRYYVYLYIDPRNDEIFYVGKGKGERCFSHLKEISESKKAKKIHDIISDGFKPVIEILVHDLDEETALRVEASVIDLIGVAKLTNQVKGHSSSRIGRMSLEKIISIYQPEKAQISEPALLIKINQTFRYGISPQELYDATRQFWRIGEDREKVKLAFAVFDGTIQEIYEVVSWHKAGTTFSSRVLRDTALDRWEFVGQIADEEIRERYLYKDVSDLIQGQNPFRYINIKNQQES